MDRPHQAVIVAGGRGERLRPLTDTLPKPMIGFHGRPFLAYLLDLLRDNGFDEVLMLLGYRASTIEEWLAARPDDGLRIRTAVSDPAIHTGLRVWLAREQLEERFLFMYCDNYWPMPWPRMWDTYRAQGWPAQVTVYANDDGYSRDNVALDETGRVVAYDPTRSSAGLGGVEIGYAILERGAVGAIAGRDVPFEHAVYPPLIDSGDLGAFVTRHRYYSVGTLARLPETERFLGGGRAVILDRDGVLNERPPRAEYIREPGDLHWLPGALDALRLLNDAGYQVFVASNQAGVARGAMTIADVEAVNARLAADARAAGGRIDAIYYCPHGWDDGCDCRKPRPGLLFRAQREFALDLTRTPFIGDDERDAQAADAAGCPALLVDNGQTLLDVVGDLLHDRLEPVGAS
jgi:histidinol-phosphate phosphatase family protein